MIRRTASEVLQSLEARIARLEGRTASTRRAAMDLSAYDDNIDPETLPESVQDKLLSVGAIEYKSYYGTKHNLSQFSPYEDDEVDVIVWTAKAYALGLRKGRRRNTGWN